MSIRFHNWRIQVLRCDNCGKVNPPLFDNNNRLCANCATMGGFYKAKGKAGEGDYRITLGANGKINWWTLQIPFRFTWKGFWRF